MKATIYALIVGVGALGMVDQATAQGFVNLNFESAVVVPNTPPGTTLSTAAAFPGWTTSWSSAAGVRTTFGVGYKGLSIGSSDFYLIDSIFATGGTYDNRLPLQGSYSASLAGGIGSQGQLDTSVLSQTGIVPNGANSIYMDISLSSPGGKATFTVDLDGQIISMVPVQVFSTYTRYGGDISGFAGKSSKLSISSPPTDIPNSVLLDDISFSTVQVPEPGIAGWCVASLVILGIWRNRRSSKEK